MKKFITGILVVVLGLCLTASAFADNTTREEVIAKVKEAAMLIANTGQEAAFKEINNKEGRFVWGGGTYLTVMDFEGIFLARGDRQKAIGKNWLNWKDKSNPPKQPMKEMVDLAKKKGEGWVEYWYPKPGPDFDHAAPSKKIAYIYKVPGHDILVTAGFYE